MNIANLRPRPKSCAMCAGHNAQFSEKQRPQVTSSGPLALSFDSTIDGRN